MEPVTITYNVEDFLKKMSEFQRVHPDPNDCVINALQILGIVDEKQAGIMIF